MEKETKKRKTDTSVREVGKPADMIQTEKRMKRKECPASWKEVGKSGIHTEPAKPLKI